MTTTSSPYCDFVDTNQVFNKKRVYQCSYCNLRLGLEDPSAKILCFKKMQDFRVSVQKLNDPSYEEPIHLTPEEPMQNIILEAAVKKYGIKEQTKEDPSNMCSQEEIQQRLNICEQCEHYKDIPRRSAAAPSAAGAAGVAGAVGADGAAWAIGATPMSRPAVNAAEETAARHTRGEGTR